jgi:hypothetical protein
LPLAQLSRMLPRRMSTRQTSFKIAGESLYNRSRITNGSALLPDIDGRSIWARRLRDVLQLHLDDLGGEDAVSEAERSLLRRAAVLTTECEFLEAKIAQAHNEGRSPPERDMDLYLRCAGVLKRLLETVGLRRRARDIGRTGALEPYL